MLCRNFELVSLPFHERLAAHPKNIGLKFRANMRKLIINAAEDFTRTDVDLRVEGKAGTLARKRFILC